MPSASVNIFLQGQSSEQVHLGLERLQENIKCQLERFYLKNQSSNECNKINAEKRNVDEF